MYCVLVVKPNAVKSALLTNYAVPIDVLSGLIL